MFEPPPPQKKKKKKKKTYAPALASAAKDLKQPCLKLSGLSINGMYIYSIFVMYIEFHGCILCTQRDAHNDRKAHLKLIGPSTKLGTK